MGTRNCSACVVRCTRIYAPYIRTAPLKLRPYGAIQICLLLLLLLLLYYALRSFFMIRGGCRFFTYGPKNTSEITYKNYTFTWQGMRIYAPYIRTLYVYATGIRCIVSKCASTDVPLVGMLRPRELPQYFRYFSCRFTVERKRGRVYWSLDSWNPTLTEV